MWFKNLYLYRLQQDFSWSAEDLHEKLAERPFRPCTEEQRESVGWDSPLGRDSEIMAHGANGCVLVSMAHQERMLPGSVIREELDNRLAELEARDGRKVTGREKKDLKEQIEFELLPKAFTRTRHIDAWLDPYHHWLILNTSSATQAERLTHHLRASVDSLPIKMPETELSPVSLMTQWLREGELPTPFELGEECELRSQGDDQSVAVFKKHELRSDEVISNLDNGKMVSKLMLVWDDKISFMLTDNLLIKRLKFLDVFAEQLDEQDPQSQAEKKDIEFALMTGEIAQMLSDLLRCLNPQQAEQEQTQEHAEPVQEVDDTVDTNVDTVAETDIETDMAEVPAAEEAESGSALEPEPELDEDDDGMPPFAVNTEMLESSESVDEEEVVMEEDTTTPAPTENNQGAND